MLTKVLYQVYVRNPLERVRLRLQVDLRIGFRKIPMHCGDVQAGITRVVLPDMDNGEVRQVEPRQERRRVPNEGAHQTLI